MQIELRDYQCIALEYLRARPTSALFAKPGLGKTLVILKLLDEQREQEGLKRVLIVAPKNVCELVWPNEIEKWGFDFSYAYMHGSARSTVAKGPQFITLTTPDTLTRMLQNGLQLGWDALIVDESSTFKNVRSQRFKTLKKALKASSPKRRHCLTGTPMPNHLLELWPQVFIADAGRALGSNFYQYRNRFFYQTGYGGYTWTLFKGAEKNVFKRLRMTGSAISIPHSALKELPSLHEVDVPVELGAHMEAYTQLERQFLLEIDGDNVLAVNAAVLSGRLAEFTSGAAYTKAPIWKAIHTHKEQALLRLLEERQGAPLLIFYQFKHELERYKKALRDVKFGMLEGTAAKKRMIATQWAKGELEALLLHPASAGHGLNLQCEGADICWTSLSWSGELYEQGNSRIHRQGQASAVTVYRLIVPGTVDEDMALRLKKKEQAQQQVFEFLKARWKARHE